MKTRSVSSRLLYFLPVLLLSQILGCSGGGVSTTSTTWTGPAQLGTPARDSAFGIATDVSGNVYVAGGSSGDIDNCGCVNPFDGFVVKYADEGTAKWQVEFEADSGYTNLRSVTASSGGVLFAGGETDKDLAGGGSHVGGTDLFLCKLDADGNQEWIRQMGTGSDDTLRGVASDARGNVYLAGYTYGGMDGNQNAGESDSYVMMIDSNGGRLWTFQLGSPGWDRARGVAVDASGNVYAAGQTHGSLDNANLGGSDVFVVKLDAAGKRVWVRQFGTTETDEGFSVSVDYAENVYVAGMTEGDLGGTGSYAGGADAFVMKLDADGNRVWATLLGTPSKDEIRAVTVDGSGFVYVTGSTDGSLADGNNGESDIFVAQLSPGGDVRWIRQFGTDLEESAAGIALDPAGSIFVSGSTFGDMGGSGNAGDCDVFVVKFNPDGDMY